MLTFRFLKYCLPFALLFMLPSCKNNYADLPDGIYAVLETQKGDIILQLAYDKAPITVANFITLAEGTNQQVSEPYKNKPFFDGLTFHRVEKQFVIQGGDPFGNGSGDPGYAFEDEFSDLRHDKPGTLSMANSGPNTNGSQFFITYNATPSLDGRHAVFGYALPESMKVVEAIDRDDVMETVRIIRHGEKAKKFDAAKVFEAYYLKKVEQAGTDSGIKQGEKDAQFAGICNKQKAYFDASIAKSTPTGSGLKYLFLQHGKGGKPKKGQEVQLWYAGFFTNGHLFDSNKESVAQQFGLFDKRAALQGRYRPMPYEYGSANMIAGFLEGLSLMEFGDRLLIFVPAKLGYGAQGAGEVIPPNSNLVFEIELIPNK
ncbi:MAG: peptidylprolyl isomerase [Flavobacterium sp. BFFFF2]|nr:MAG: peptidylprolyl isomerase [Flavobacterium sp. BFFFF2]